VYYLIISETVYETGRGKIIHLLEKARGGNYMKKRILSLLMALMLGLSFVSAVPVSHASAATAEEITTYAGGQNFSDWAMMDLITGDTYGIYPLEWYNNDMTAPITRVQLRKVIAEVRVKLFGTDAVTDKLDNLYYFKKYSTVEEVLVYYYQMLTEFTFTKDLGLNGKTAVQFMKTNGIYGTVSGEQSLKDRCSVEQACVIGTRVVTFVYKQLGAGSKGFLWKTTSGENTVYMLGSIHMASTDIYPMSSDILQAYASADALAVELNMYDTVGATQMAMLGIYTDGTTLKDHVSEETYKKTIALAAKYGYSEDIIAMCKPWYIYVTFAAISSTDSGSVSEATQAANLGIDINFTTNALVTGKTILEVEGYVYQGQVLDSFSDDLEEYLLNSTIDSINDLLEGKTENTGADDIEAMLQLWKDGDTETFAEYSSFDNEYPELSDAESTEEIALIKEFKDKLLTQRDKGMADFIDNLLKSEGSHTYFVIVGSGHYISDYDVLDILTEKGYQITQIK
jgi:uncharacterized protein YbaP (TraB family)